MALGPLMIDVHGLELSDEDRELLRHPRVGGVILFARNYADRAQLALLTESIHALRHPPLLIAVDHEGGRVQRFRAGFTPLPPAANLGARLDRDGDSALEDARDCGLQLAVELRTVGVDFSFAPCLDVHGRSSVIGDRALHRDPRAVARLGRAFVRGMHEGGMAAIGKHFPGHGAVAADSHHELPVDDRDLADIEQHDLIPFRLLIDEGLDGIMPAHVLFPRVDAHPASLSKRWLHDILRGDLGFQGAVLSDDVSMAAAAGAGQPVERAHAALTAGCDMVLMCNDRAAAIAVAHGLQWDANPLAQVRLMRLHGRRPPCTAAELEQSPRWRRLAERVTGLNGVFELGLEHEDLV
jgi:beta-N-acetylhexosaminidase